MVKIKEVTSACLETRQDTIRLCPVYTGLKAQEHLKSLFSEQEQKITNVVILNGMICNGKALTAYLIHVQKHCSDTMLEQQVSKKSENGILQSSIERIVSINKKST